MPMVHPEGLEPPRHCCHKNLNLTCLPIPPRVQPDANRISSLIQMSMAVSPILEDAIDNGDVGLLGR